MGILQLLRGLSGSLELLLEHRTPPLRRGFGVHCLLRDLLGGGVGFSNGSFHGLAVFNGSPTAPAAAAALASTAPPSVIRRAELDISCALPERYAANRLLHVARLR